MANLNKNQSPGRNAPCPCGSGKKYKRCCMSTDADQNDGKRRPRITKMRIVLGLLLITLVVAASIVFIGSSAESPVGSTPAAWEYDEANNRHWHSGHGHWHDGPPPPQYREAPDQATEQLNGPTLSFPEFNAPPSGAAESGEAATIETPEPWEYDAENNRHWHPGHGHWHRGPPPNQ